MRLRSLAACLALSACGVSQATLTALEADVSRSREDLEHARRLQKALDAYVRAQKSNNFDAPYSFVYLGPGDLLQAVSTFFPYKVPAQALLDGASGEVEVVSVNQPRFEPRNRVRLQLTLAGKGLGSDGSRAADALAAGAVAEVEARLAYDPTRRFVAVRPACSSVILRRNDDPETREQVRAALNRALFDRSFPVPVPPVGNRPAETVFLTGDHVVIQYRL